MTIFVVIVFNMSAVITSPHDLTNWLPAPIMLFPFTPNGLNQFTSALFAYRFTFPSLLASPGYHKPTITVQPQLASSNSGVM